MSQPFFDTGPEPEATPLPEDTPEPAVSTQERVVPAKPVKPKRQIFGYDLFTLLGGAGAIIALLVYAFWPEPTPVRQLTEEPVVQQAAPEEPFAPEPEVSPPPVTPEVPAPEPSPPAVPESNPALEASVTALSGRQDNSEKRIEALEARLKALEQQPRPQAAPTTPVRKATQPKPVARSAPARTTPAQRSGVIGWRINSVYPGMAWLSDGKSTWAVYPGDTLHGLRIEAIDAARREVRTSQGVIRQGD